METRQWWRRLSRVLWLASRWCYAKAQPSWVLGDGGFMYRGRRIGRPSDAWRTIVRRDPCSYCGGRGGTLEHIRPTSRGGGQTWKNEVGACRACNEAKADGGLLLFLHARHKVAMKRAPIMSRRERMARESAARMAQPAPYSVQGGGGRR
jgi:hypothetical protein